MVARLPEQENICPAWAGMWRAHHVVSAPVSLVTTSWTLFATYPGLPVQTLPALVFGLFTVWFRAEGLLLGWAVGIGWGSYTAWSNGLKPLASISLGDTTYTFYVGLGALLLNIVVAVLANAVLSAISPAKRSAAA